MVSVPLDSSDTNTRETCSGDDRSTARLWDCEEVPSVVQWKNGSRG